MKKIFYIPGMISIIGLPLMIYFLYPKPKVMPTAMKLNLPSDKIPKDWKESFNSKMVYENVRKRKIEHIQFDHSYISMDETGYYHKLQLQFVYDEMKRLQFTHDTSTVLKIELDDDNTYGDFVSIINWGVFYGYKRYAFLDDCFYFFPNDPYVKTKYESISIDTSVHYVIESPNHIEYQKPTQWDYFIWGLEYRLSLYELKSWQKNSFVAAFILLIVFPAIYKIRKNRKLSVK